MQADQPEALSTFTCTECDRSLAIVDGLETHIVGVCVPCTRRPGWHRDAVLAERPADVLLFPSARRGRTGSGVTSPDIRDRVISDVILELLAIANGEAAEPTTHREMLLHIAARTLKALEDLYRKGSAHA